MVEESTGMVLEKILNSKSLDDVSSIMKKTDANLDKSFQGFFNDYLSQNPGLELAQIIKDSGLDKTYAYQMTGGKKKKPSRDHVLALCYAARMNCDEVNHALTYTNNANLYAKNSRDAALIYAFSKNKKDKHSSVTELNVELTDREFEPIKTSKGRV